MCVCECTCTLKYVSVCLCSSAGINILQTTSKAQGQLPLVCVFRDKVSSSPTTLQAKNFPVPASYRSNEIVGMFYCTVLCEFLGFELRSLCLP